MANARTELLNIQKELLLHPDEELALVEQTKTQPLAELTSVEEAYLKQRSRCNGLEKEIKILDTFTEFYKGI